MATKPRGYYTMEDRDAVITDTAAEVSEIAPMVKEIYPMVRDMHICLLGIPQTDDKGMCGEIKDAQNDLRSFKRDVVKGAVAGAGLIITLVFGVNAIF